MTIEATSAEIHALLQLAEIDARAPGLAPDALRKAREAAAKRVTRALLERYAALLEAGRCPAICAIDRGVCSGCHVRLPTMVEAQSRRTLAVLSCPHCRRMLYSRELLGEDAAPAPAAKPAARTRRGVPASTARS